MTLALEEYTPLNIKNSPIKALVRGSAILASAMMTSMVVSTGAFCGNTAQFADLTGLELFFDQVYARSRAR